MMNLKKIDPITIALVLGLAAALYWKKNGDKAPKKEGYCGACRGGR